jgi:hypothetical protein
MQLKRVMLFAIILSLPAVSARAATYYVGAFAGSTPSDDPSCGGGMGAAPSAHPCKTLAFWTGSRNIAANGDTVRIAPGTYTSTAPSNCLDAAKTGVTYRGSTASGADTNDRSLVVISGSTGPIGNPCRGAVVKFTTGTSSNVTIRDLTVNGCPNADNGHCMQFSPQPGSGTLSGLTIANVRVANGKNTGLWVGAYDSSPGPTGEFTEPFNSSNVTIVDSEFDSNCFQTGSNGAGIQIAAVNGGTIARNKIHDNRSCTTTPSGSPPNETCTRTGLPPICPNDDCNCDGLHLGGRNFQVYENEIYGNEEDGVDTGPNGSANDCPKTTARFHVFERNRLHDNGIDNFSMNGCAHDLTVRNNMIWGAGKGINQYECAGFNSSYYNNTIWTKSSALFVYSTMWPFTMKNNILVSSAGDTTIWMDGGSTNTSSTWDNNIVQNIGSGFAARVDFTASASQFPNCTTGSGTNCCTDPDGPRSAGTIPAVGRSNSVDYRNADLGKWQADGDAGNLFGSGTGNNDHWGVPALLNSAQLNVANIHLAGGDTLAIDHGATIAGFSTDFDGDTRPQGSAWDIGADEARSGPQAPAPPALISVDPVP